MTICASVKVRDGLVLGTDSMTQIWQQDGQGNRGIIKAYGNARKLFQIGSGSIAVMTYGIGNLGPRSIQGFIRDFGHSYSGSEDVKDVSQELYNYFRGEYDKHYQQDNRPALGLYIAGLSKNQPFPEEWEFRFPRDQEVRSVRPIDSFGASWRGIDLPFTRLYSGYDPRLVQDLCQLGLSIDAVQEALGKYKSAMVFDGMPVQDAIDFAVFILQTTIRLSTFEVGVPACGGPLQVAVILPDTGFEWIQKPMLQIKYSQ